MKRFGKKKNTPQTSSEELLCQDAALSTCTEEASLEDTVELLGLAKALIAEDPQPEQEVSEQEPEASTQTEAAEETPTEETSDSQEEGTAEEEAPSEEEKDGEEPASEAEKDEEEPASEEEKDGEEPASEEEKDEEEPDSGEEKNEEQKPPMSFLKKMLISCGATVVVLSLIVALTVNYFLSLLNYQKADSDFFKTVAPSELEEETYEDSELAALDAAEKAKNLEATEEDLLRWNKHIDKITSDSSTYEIPISEDVYNILLVGTDNRAEGAVGRSDVMMLVSINQKTETIHLTSFLRDCYVAVPGYGKTRMNHSYAYGGPALLMETIETNFKVHVDRYVAVDFYSFMDVVDTLGGVWIYMNEDEIKTANKYIWSMNVNQLGLDWSDGYIWGDAGWRKLTGKQALGHARNRFDGNDYERTARQRNIINQILNGCKYATPSTLVDLAQVILPQITTDMTKSEILSYAANVGAYIGYNIEQHQIPAEGTYSGATISGMSVISLDLDENIQYLQDTIYAGTDALEEETDSE